MPRVKISIVFESGARIGPDKARLLGRIRDAGLDVLQAMAACLR
jgi:hypothetical protein